VPVRWQTHSARPAVAWRRAVFALFAVAAGTNVPTPLLLVYQERLDVSPQVLTALFGTYAAGLVPALFLAGPLSDTLGRRRVAIPSIALSAVASLAFAAAGGSLELLFGARFLQGVVAGAVFSVGSAWVGELSLASGEAAGGRRAAVAMTAGFSLGPLTSGLLGQYAPAPTVLPYLVHVALVAVGLAVAVRLPETVNLVGGRRSRAEGEPGVPLIRRGDGLLVGDRACPGGGVRLRLPGHDDLGGAAAGPAAGGRRRGHRRARWSHARRRHAGGRAPARFGPWTAVIGTALGAAGFAAAAAFTQTGQLRWLVVCAPALGAGSGLCLAAGLTLTARLAAPSRRGALTSLFLACAYVGFAAPFLTASAARATSAAVPLAVAAGMSGLLAVRLLPVARRGQL
jgi:MFS family permease